jgi:hypothetical protein
MTTTTTSLSSFLPPVPSNALLYQRATTNPIGVTAATSTNLGYLSQNKSQLEVVGQLTGQDPIDMYNFTLQQGSSINAHLTNINETVPVHVQILDGSGTRVLADNQGNAAQQQAFAQLTSTTGLKATPGKYVIKVSYGNGAAKSQAQNYAIQLDSGTTFTSDYRTLAAATTVNLTLLQGGSVGYNSASSTASMLTSVSEGTSLSIFNVLSNSAGTNILA